MLKFKINKIDINNKNFYNILEKIINFNINKYLKIENYIKNIIFNIKQFKDKSLKFYLKKFENYIIKNINEIKKNKKDLEKSYNKLDYETKYLLELSKNRIEIFHEKQLNNFKNNWKIIENDGNIMGQKNNNIENVGLYIPGGKAVYFSSILMNVIPSTLSNVNNIIVCSPIKKNVNILLAALFLCGIKEFYNIGGVLAISSMYFGNNILKKVNKIFGPGNFYVSTTKKILFGNVGIDMVAGPSEITIISDSNSDPRNIVMNLFSQSEHDNLSQSILICDNNDHINLIEIEIKKYIPFLYKKKIIYNSILNNIIIIKVNNLNEAFNLLNYISPEHLIISIKNELEFFKNIKNCGSNFLGKKTCEAFGDYTSGLNHVIPTNKNSKFSSPLGVYDFNKNLNFLKINNLSFKKLFNPTINFSKKEKLYSHYESIKNYF